MLRLAIAQSCLPGRDLAERLDYAAQRSLAIEAEFTGADCTARPFTSAGVEVISVQCLPLKQSPPSHPDSEVRERALDAIQQTIAFAGAVEARHLITIGDYRPHPKTVSGAAEAVPVDRSAIDFYTEVLDRCQPSLERHSGLKVLLEPLSRQRAKHFTEPGEIVAVLDHLARPDLFGLVLDTGHLLDGRPVARNSDAAADLTAQLEAHAGRCDELQLRGPSSKPPDPDWPFSDWLQLLSPGLSVVTVEHRSEPDPSVTDLLVETLQKALRGMR